MAPPVFYATPGREPSAVLGQAFIEGSGGRFTESRFLEPGPAAFYGVSKFTLPIWRACQEQEREFYYLDNGYFRPGHFEGFYRVTRNAAQIAGEGRGDPARWRALGLDFAPWRQGGRHVLVIGQSRTYFEMRGQRPGDWLWETLAQISRATDRPIIVRPKPRATSPKRPLADDLRDAWCVVCHTSNVAVEAVLAGIPAFVTGACAARPMAETDLSKIETPRRPDGREQWAGVLAANQWTLDEIRSGKCWSDLHV